MDMCLTGDNFPAADPSHQAVTFALLDDGSQCHIMSSFSDSHVDSVFKSSKSGSMEKSACKQKCKETYKVAKKECKSQYKSCKKPAKSERKSCKKGCKSAGVDELSLLSVMSLRDPRALGRSFL